MATKIHFNGRSIDVPGTLMELVDAKPGRGTWHTWAHLDKRHSFNRSRCMSCMIERRQEGLGGHWDVVYIVDGKEKRERPECKGPPVEHQFSWDGSSPHAECPCGVDRLVAQTIGARMVYYRRRRGDAEEREWWNDYIAHSE